MGQEILYCFRCQTRLTSFDFLRGEAFRVDDQAACAACTREVLPSFPLKKQREILNQSPRKELPAEATPRTPRRPVPAAAPRSVALPVAIAVVALLVVIVVVSFSRPAPPPPPAVEAPRIDREKPARVALDVARAADAGARLRLLEKVAADHVGTEAARDARRDVDALLEARRKAVANERAALFERVRGLVAAEEFQKALDLLRDERKRHIAEEWTGPIDARAKEIGETAAKLFPPLKEKAVDARKTGQDVEAKSVRARVESWGPDFVLELDKALLEAVPPTVPRKDGTILLRIAEASMTGKKMKKVGQGDWCILQGWKDVDDRVEWSAIPAAGTYTVEANYALPDDGGGEFSIRVGSATRTFPMPSTGGWGKFKDVTVGTLTVPTAGLCRVVVQPVKITHYLGSLRYVKLVPAR